MSDRDAMRELEEWLREDHIRDAILAVMKGSMLVELLARDGHNYAGTGDTLSEAILNAIDEAK